ncbi:TPA: hypothetical protein ACU4A8_000503 [Streptococcus pyogenes]
MEQPVKANDKPSLQSRSESLKKGGNYDYDKERQKGFDQGYIDGQRKGAPKEPDSSSYGSSFDPYNGYRDGYDEGYALGWHQTNDTGNSRNEESQSSGGTQDKVKESTDDSRNEESQSSGGTQDKVEESTNDTQISNLLSSIVETFLTLVLSWFNLD